ncbi:putative DMT superfamily transporter inner membrane protein [Pseudomonas sp. THAF187a]|uniref:DMT family transporter n=1 Tax=Pseudomonadaceae TaxID=135621 RepID=UPI001268B050|nr:MULTISPECIES: DMT family transporter [unclassified Pseudomonas]QFT22340.1 putative DMT superfamily transporter inner membrane protein [Pseudomonas sp. THAF187a]QFT42527.1 putative DMT superfamily transporter inner membrane protein [Pseudomonas sp. THAF42]WFC62617.1 DMT family transporter [Pseudomonas sp. REST10]
MTAVRKGADFFLFQLMLLLCAIWGSQQVAIKLAAEDIAPMLQVALRSGIAAVLVGILLLWQRGWRGWLGSTWLAGILAGVLFALEFFFIALGLRYTSASHMAVFLYTAPIFSALGLHLMLPSERLRRLQWLGIALCFGGVVMAFGVGGDWSEIDADILLGDALGLCAGMAWGATTVVVRGSRLSEAPAGLTLFYQLTVAFVLLLGYALAMVDLGQVRWTPLAIGSVLLQGVVVSFFTYLAWFWLLRRYLASNMAVFSFMTPLFGVTFGVLVLDEPLTLNFIIGAALVLAGIMLVSSERWLKRRLAGLRGQ